MVCQQPPAKISDNITRDPDGVYRWVYQMSLFRNPAIFLLVWKIFFFILLGIFGFMALLDLIESGGDEALGLLKVLGWALLGMTALVGVSFLIYAAIMGGKYIVQFEMDETGITHRQISAQARKAQKLGAAAILMGAAAGNRGGMSAGIAASQTEMTSEFARVGKVRACPRRHLIKVRQGLFHNQVYAAPEDFEFVYRFIVERCPKLKGPM